MPQLLLDYLTKTFAIHASVTAMSLVLPELKTSFCSSFKIFFCPVFF